MKLQSTIIGGLVAMFVGACSAASAPVADTTSMDADGVDTEVVLLNPDGTHVSRHYVASREEVAREIAARAGHLPNATPSPSGDGLGHTASAISTASCLDGNAIWIQDTSSCTSYNHRICFIGAGTVNLHDYFYTYWSGQYLFKIYWDNAIHSYWPGNSGGRFTYGLNPENFYSGQGCTAITPPWNTLTLWN